MPNNTLIYPPQGGGGGIQSINGDTTSAQVIAAGTGISVSTASGTTTISSSGSSGANVELSNLSGVAVNTDLVPASTGSSNIGSATLPWGSGYFATGVGTGPLPPTTGSGNYLWLIPSSGNGAPAIQGYTNSNSYCGIQFTAGGGFTISDGFGTAGQPGSIQGNTAGIVYINGYAFQVYNSYTRCFGQFQIWPIGQTISVSQGTNGCIGNGTDALASGTKTISTAAVTSTSQILVTPTSAPLGQLYEYSAGRVPGTSFTIKSTNSADTCSFTWWIVEIH